MFQRIKSFVVVFILSFSFASMAHSQSIQAGRDYEILESPLAVDNKDGKVSVIEFFSYGCPHCHNFESELRGWKKANRRKVDFQPSPVVFQGTSWGAEFFAEIYYTLAAMDLLEKHHEDVFIAVIKNGLNLGNEEILNTWLSTKGIDVDKFAATRKSFTIATQIKGAKQRMNDAGVDSTPQIIVGGKYRVLPVTTFKRILEVADILITREAVEAKRSK